MEILFVAHRAPLAPDRGDKIRGYHLLRHLASRARVHLVAFADPAGPDEPPPGLASMTLVRRTRSTARSAAEALVTGRPVSLAAFADTRLARAVATVLRERPIDAIYCFSGQMAQYLPADVPPVLMDFVDVDSAKFATLAQDGASPRHWLLRREARLLAAFERDVAARVAASIFVSDGEAALFRTGGGSGRIVAIENGVDAGFFDPAASFDPVDEAGPLVVFTGQMDYAPNIEAARLLVDDIMPAVRRRHPHARAAIVGRAPIAAVRAMAGPGVIVTGAVADTRGWLAAAAVCVAPLRLARGVQNKVLEAMAMARPVVASAPAAEGIDHDGSIAVAPDVGGLADAVSALLDDPVAAAQMGAAARQRVLARYAWPARLAPLDALIGEVT